MVMHLPLFDMHSPPQYDKTLMYFYKLYKQQSTTVQIPLADLHHGQEIA